MALSNGNLSSSGTYDDNGNSKEKHHIYGKRLGTGPLKDNQACCTTAPKSRTPGPAGRESARQSQVAA